MLGTLMHRGGRALRPCADTVAPEEPENIWRHTVRSTGDVIVTAS